MAIEIRVNGEKKFLGEPVTVAGLLQSLRVNPDGVVVERNLEIVPREQLDEEMIDPGDVIEIIRLVGGG